MYMELHSDGALRTYTNTFYQILDTMIRDMTTAPLTDSISRNFIVQMIPHHRAAIQMSQNILRYTPCTPVQQIAARIIQAQTQSIAAMERVFPTCSRRRNRAPEVRAYQNQINQIMDTMFRAMENAVITDNLSETFMRQMIPHHRGAVEMSALALQQNICPELQPILQAIHSSQMRGIQQMEWLLRDGTCRNVFAEKSYPG